MLTTSYAGLVPLLKARFPKSFGLPKNQRRPFKVGIAADLADYLNSPELAHRVLKRWTKKRTYLRGMARGGFRIDLEGNDCEVVTPEHQSSAVKWLDLMDSQKKIENKKPPEKEALKRAVFCGTNGAVGARTVKLSLKRHGLTTPMEKTVPASGIRNRKLPREHRRDFTLSDGHDLNQESVRDCNPS